MRYDFVLFDADETLFSFDILAGMKVVFSRYGINFTQADYEHYQESNKKLWISYQNGEISSDYLQITRFSEWGAKLNIAPKQLNDEFLDAMAQICEPLPGVVNLLTQLKGKAKLAIVTNGFHRLQSTRIHRAGLDGVFDYVVISELVGSAKPHKAIFEHTLSLLGNPSNDRVLMVGDTITSDILGGKNMGIDTCWLQHPGVINTSDIKPTYTISHLDELHEIIGI
ncbi:pyrimidine 5'-nucleotidase [Glaciecola sp. MF2-115]|uniref:pyrimidine 5'-nucleotidase n=1 Tax=Glaciecola sp. MF2-115 TaxID=3384827 RepID=UPI0039A294C7